MLENQNFTNPQGTTITDGVVRMLSINSERRWNGNEVRRLTINFDDVDAALNENVDDYDNERLTVGIEIGYWMNRADYDANLMPYTLTNSEGRDRDTFQVPDGEFQKAEYDGLGLEQQCEKYFTDVILPTLQTQGA